LQFLFFLLEEMSITMRAQLVDLKKKHFFICSLLSVSFSKRYTTKTNHSVLFWTKKEKFITVVSKKKTHQDNKARDPDKHLFTWPTTERATTQTSLSIRLQLRNPLDIRCFSYNGDFFSLFRPSPKTRVNYLFSLLFFFHFQYPTLIFFIKNTNSGILFFF